MRISAIAAMTRNRVIGKGNQLIWNLPEDLRRFRQITLGYPIIMGRKTFESIGRVLPGRKNIIVSRQAQYSAPGASVVTSLEDALRESHGSEEVFIIGGAEIYQLALNRVQRLYLTRIHQEMDGDAYFPEFNESDFVEVSREEREATFSYSFVVLDRKLC